MNNQPCDDNSNEPVYVPVDPTRERIEEIIRMLVKSEEVQESETVETV